MRPTQASTPLSRPVTGASRPSAPVYMPSAPATYRPRGALATLLTLVPAVGVLIVLALLLMVPLRGMAELIALGVCGGFVFGWLVGLIALAPMLLITVNTSSDGIEATWPWGKARTLAWRLIDRVDTPLGNLRLHASDGQSLTLLTSALTDSHRLVRMTLLRVSPTVLSLPLQQELALLGGGIFATGTPPDMPPITMAAIWPALAAMVALAGTTLAVIGSLLHAGVWLAIGVPTGLVGVALVLLWRQTIVLTDQTITVVRGMGRPKTISWSDVELIEQSPLGIALALRSRDRQRIVLLGPFFLTGLRRYQLLDALNKHLLSRDVQVFQRWMVW